MDDRVKGQGSTVGGDGVVDEERLVELSDESDAWVDDDPVLPGTTRDDTDAGWGEQRHDNDARLLAERPPHWDEDY